MGFTTNKPTVIQGKLHIAEILKIVYPANISYYSLTTIAYEGAINIYTGKMA